MRKYDMFGRPVGLTFGGAKTVNSNFGLFCSIIIRTVVIYFFMTKIVTMIKGLNPRMAMHELKVSLTDPNNKHEYTPTDSNFNIAFGLTNGVKLTPDIGFFEAFYTVMTVDESSDKP